MRILPCCLISPVFGVENIHFTGVGVNDGKVISGMTNFRYQVAPGVRACYISFVTLSGISKAGICDSAIK